MTRLQTLTNRLERLQAVRDNYTGSQKIGGKIIRNKNAGRYALICTKISREIRNLNK